MAWHSGKPADSDFLSASVRHIRENFAELEPLQPHVAELVDLTALQPHVAALLDSRIVDHNLDVADPPNGYYVRVDNGLQVAITLWQTVISLEGNTLLEVQWSYPAVFTTVVFVAGETIAFGTNLPAISAVTTKIRTTGTSTLSAILQNSGSSARDVRPLFLAIGRWK